LSNGQSPPPFRMLASTTGFLTDEEMDRIIAEHSSELSEGKLGKGQENDAVRRSQIFFFSTEEKNHWLYQRIWKAALQVNEQFMCVDIAGIEGNIQLARYDAADQGFYNWHTDFGHLVPHRKISISVQLSAPEDYEGGDLEFFFDGEPVKGERARGALIAFPSFTLHRVAPVTRGTRWSLVAWIAGNRWR